MKKIILNLLILLFMAFFTIEVSAQDSGACCLGGYCFSLTLQDYCDSLGGNWYEGETCPEFACPEKLVGQPPNGENGIFSDIDCDICDSGIQILAENFALPQNLGIRINGLTFWGGYYPSFNPLGPDCIDVIFRDEVDGVPGNEIARVTCSIPLRIPPLIWSVYYLYFIDLSEEDIIFVPPTNTIFVEVYNNTEGNDDSWFWETGDLDVDNGIPGQAYTFTLPEEPWNYDPTSDLAFFIDGESEQVGIDDYEPPAPDRLALMQNYPNPFNETTVIRYSLPHETDVKIDIFNILGRKVSRIQDGLQQAGYHQAIWNAKDQSSGTYLYRIQAGEYDKARRMLLLK